MAWFLAAAQLGDCWLSCVARAVVWALASPTHHLWVPQASRSSPPPGDSPTLDDIRNHDTTSFKQYFAQPGNEGFVYGTNAIPAITTRANVTEQADNTAAMPIPFETLIPYGIIIAVSSRRAAAPLDPGR
jgi:hypothetical protein